MNTFLLVYSIILGVIFLAFPLGIIYLVVTDKDDFTKKEAV